MVVFLLLNLLIVNFQQKWYCSKGTAGPYGRVLVGDTDCDSQIELIFGYGESLQDKIVVYELYPDSLFYLEAIIDTMANETWSVGDFDVDGLHDLLLMGDFGLPVVGLQIYESPDSFSYPIIEIWRDTVGPPAVHPVCVYDIDQDNIPEIVKEIAPPYGNLAIYEAVGDNQYDLIYTDSNSAPSSTIAFGDYDQDGNTEFAMGNLSAGAPGAWYWVYECSANNTYELIAQDAVLTKNIKDCISVPDADGDGKWEFVVKGYVIPSSRIDVFIFEATSDNAYEIVDTLILQGGDYGGGYSAAGDVDGDSIPEIVLEARQNVFIIKASGNDSFYVWDTLPGNDAGSSIAVYNIDGNEYQDIVISGNHHTRIYEYNPEGVEEYRSSNEVKHNFFPTVFTGPLLLPEGVNCRVFDITGRAVLPQQVKPGVYFVEVDGEIRQKVVKVR